MLKFGCFRTQRQTLTGFECRFLDYFLLKQGTNMSVSSPFGSIDVPEISLAQVLLGGLAQHGDKIAMVEGVSGDSYTFNDLISISKRLASALYRRGARKGDTLALYLPNYPEFFMLEFAAFRIGMTVTTANPMYTKYEFSRQIADSKPRFIFAGQDNAANAKSAAVDHSFVQEVIVRGTASGCTSFHHLMEDDGSLCPENVPCDAKNDVVLLPYSSGTTGLPKGVMLTHYNIVANLMQIAHTGLSPPPDENAPPRVLLGFLPFYHSYGGIILLFGGLLGGAKIVTLPKFVPEHFLGCIEKYKVSFLYLVPPIVVFMAKHPMVKNYDLSSVVRAGCGAAPLKKSTEEEFTKLVKVNEMRQGYGLTETGPAATGHPYDKTKSGSVGVPLANTELMIASVETGRPVLRGERGEIWIRGPQVMKGYLNRPEANADVFTADRWFKTGDIGIIDDEGYVFVVDRMKELIKYKGFQVAPAELEALLLNHPRVADVGVVGVPDDAAGEVPRAYVVKMDANLTEQDLHDFVNEKVSNFKRLRGGIVFMSKIPKSEAGKILRRELRELVKKSKL